MLYCNNCGKEIQPHAIRCERCESQTPHTCTNCGSKVSILYDRDQMLCYQCQWIECWGCYQFFRHSQIIVVSVGWTVGSNGYDNVLRWESASRQVCTNCAPKKAVPKPTDDAATFNFKWQSGRRKHR